MKKLFSVLIILAAQLFFSQKVTDLKVEHGRTKEVSSELSQEKTASCNEAFFKFISALKSSDRKTIEELLSDKVKGVVTDDVLKKLTEGIQLNKKLEISKTGYQALIDGNNYPMIQYRYSDDTSSAPEEIITAIFEEDGKILGIKPAEKGK